MTRFLRNQGWVAGLFALLIFLFVVTKLIQPGYGSGDFELGQDVRCLAQGFPVAAGAHDHTHHRRIAATHRSPPVHLGASPEN